jgi:hypothetical protein
MAIADCILQSYEMNFFVHNFFFFGREGTIVDPPEADYKKRIFRIGP